MVEQAGPHDDALTSFVGRRESLAEGRRLLGSSRLVSLVGPGGVGKTRLARRLADEVARAFPDGTYVVELAELRHGDAVAPQVASALGIEDAKRSPEDSVAAFLRDRRLLLVLDNCEHVADSCAVLVQSLLQNAEALSVVATSRQPLGVAGEQLMRVDPLGLPVPEATDSAEVAATEAVALFVERARLVVPGFTLDDTTVVLVARLCTVLDGMPLAIELAAARLRMLSLAQLTERLHDRFGVLKVAATAALPRHQTLRASVDWSFDLCSPEEQTLWSWMSVFEGGADLDAVESVCASTGINVFDAVAGLVDKSVLSPREVAGRVRYQMLDTIQAYGRDRLHERGEAEELAGRHRAYFVELMRSANQAWFGADQRDRMAVTAAEYANLRAAFETCLASPDTHQDALGLATSMWWYWVGHLNVDQLLRWLDRALDVAQPATPVTLHALRIGAFAAAMAGNLTLVRDYAARGVALPVADSAQVRADRRWLHAFLLSNAGDLAGASELDREALADEDVAGDAGAQERVEVLIGTSLRLAYAGRSDEALASVEEGIAVCRQHGDEWHLSFLLAVKGARLDELGQPEAALDAEREALRIARGGFHAWGVAHCLAFTAQIYTALGRGADAAVLFGALDNAWSDVGGTLRRGDHSRHAVAERTARDLVDEATYVAAFERGRKMTVDQAVAFVLGEQEAVAPPRTGSLDPGPVPLTRREIEVAELVARGHSNKEIALALVISPRTAEGHVTRVLDKLGFTNRARVAAWVAERRAGAG